MTPTEAIDLAERALRRGSCSAHKLAAEGCATCEASEEAVRVLRALPVLVTCGGCADCYPQSYSAQPDPRPADCSHPDAVVPNSIDRNAPPPSWCPLRGKP